MIYLGNQAVGIAYNPPEWLYVGITIEFNEYHSYDTADLFFNDSSISSALANLSDGKYKLVFENNTSNTRAGQYIKFTVENGSKNDIGVMRVGLANETNHSYGVDVYSDASAKVYKHKTSD